MARYVDGFLIPIPKDNIDKYKEIAAKAGAIWREHGALEYYECVGDDLDKEGMVSFLKSADALDAETVVFSWIVYESKEERDRINALVMADPRITGMMEPDSSHSITGGWPMAGLGHSWIYNPFGRAYGLGGGTDFLNGMRWWAY